MFSGGVGVEDLGRPGLGLWAHLTQITWDVFLKQSTQLSIKLQKNGGKKNKK